MYVARGDGQEGVTRRGKQASQVSKKARTAGGRKSSPVSVLEAKAQALAKAEALAEAKAKAFARLNVLYEGTGTAKRPPPQRTLYPEVWCY